MTWNVGVAWANVSNTPFKHYKRTQNSGGVTTPFIAQWPATIQPRKEYEDQPCHLTDLLLTLIEVSGGSYPARFGGKEHPPLPGRSVAPILTRGEILPPRTLFFSLFNNMAVMDGGWRMVTAYGQPWHLYDLTNDRTETKNLGESNPEQLQRMLASIIDFVPTVLKACRLEVPSDLPGLDLFDRPAISARKSVFNEADTHDIAALGQLP